jgi:hypothetical protein
MHHALRCLQLNSIAPALHHVRTLQIAALVLWHLRHLPEPVIPCSLYDLVVSIGEQDDSSEANNTQENEGMLYEHTRLQGLRFR